MIAGKQIGQYRILRVIGAGGMGAVYLGEHLLLQRRAAIKTLLPERARDPAIAEWFFREARATSALSDPGVVQIFDFGYHIDGTAFIVMEYLSGETLAERIVRLGRLPVAYALRIARQIASSLAVAHAAGIVHRDLKPANVFLIRDPETEGGERTKILDFGFCGTPVYMSPEQCRRTAVVDHRTDIYALGCTLFQMIAGRPPFACVSSEEFIAAHLERVPEAPGSLVEGVPAAVDELVLRCLAKDPDDRFPSMTELRLAIDALGPTIADVPVGVDLESAPSRAALGDGFRSAYVAPPALSEQAWFDDSGPTPEEPRPRRRIHRIGLAALAIAALGITSTAIWMSIDRAHEQTAAIAPPALPPAIASPRPPVAIPPRPPPAAPRAPEIADHPPPAPLPPPVVPHVAKPAPTPRGRALARRHPPRQRPVAPANEDLYDTR